MKATTKHQCPRCGQALMFPYDSERQPVQEDTTPLRWVQYHTKDRCDALMAADHALLVGKDKGGRT